MNLNQKIRFTLSAVVASSVLASIAPAQNPQSPNLPAWQGPCYNCYNHALDRRDWFFAQLLDVVAPAKITCENAKAAAIADGLAPAAWPGPPAAMPGGWPAGACPPGHSLVALAVVPCHIVDAIRKIPGNDFADPNNQAYVGDFHWYRLNGDGTAMNPFVWSHKPGQTPATDKDARGRQMNAMLPPHMADLGLYQFCCYMCVPNPPVPLGPITGLQPWEGFTQAQGYKFKYQGKEDAPLPMDPLQVLPLLPTPIPVPDPNWPDFEGPDGFGLVLPPIDPTIPPYIRVQDGVVAVYSDLVGDAATTIQYFADDNGLEDFLRGQFDRIEVRLYGLGCESGLGPLTHTMVGGDASVGGFIDYGVGPYDPVFPGAMLFGFDRSFLPLDLLGIPGGCELLVNPIGSVPLFPDPLGPGGGIVLPLPPDPALVGLELHTQGLLLDPSVPSGGGVAVSNSLEVRIR